MARRLILLITVDTNDADYNMSANQITEKELRDLLPVFAAIKKFRPYKTKAEGYSWQHTHNWPTGDFVPRTDLGEKYPEEIYKGKLTRKQIERFNDLAPYGEHGFHTVTNITVVDIANETVYLKREYK